MTRPAPDARARAYARASYPRETTFKAALLARCHPLGWIADHPLPAVRTNPTTGQQRHYTPLQGQPGRPDLWLVHWSGAIITAELKTETGRRTAEQETWAARLTRNPGVLYVLWRPSDLTTGTVDQLLLNPAEVTRLAAVQAAEAAPPTAAERRRRIAPHPVRPAPPRRRGRSGPEGAAAG